MIEWQNESSLFVIRIQGKQWYWVYKYNSDTNYRLQNVYWNVGNNNWFRTTNAGSVAFNSNNSTLIYIYEYEFKKMHKDILAQKGKSKDDLISLQYHTQVSHFIPRKIRRSKNYFSNLINNYIYYNYENDLSQDMFSWRRISKEIQNRLTTTLHLNTEYSGFTDVRDGNSSNLFDFSPKFATSYYEIDRMEDVEETSENLRIKVSNFPVKLLKGILNKHNVSTLSSNKVLNKNILFSYRLNNDQVATKIAQVEQFWGFRQKKYKKLRSFVFNQTYRFNNRSYKSIGNFVNNENFNKYNLYAGVKNNKSKDEKINVTLARRLLRTKRTLMLPAHINITIITSSYDVVHSWFIPGLGLKIDCVPGRSNHLTLYIDNIGFYYGQCAEICGRYHHHMPIRVCAINYEHFLLWWQTKGLPRMYRSADFTKKRSLLLHKFKY